MIDTQRSPCSVGVVPAERIQDRQVLGRVAQRLVLVLTGHLMKDAEFTLKFHRGDLFAGTPQESDSRVLRPQQRAPLLLEPNVEAVIELLRSAEN